MCLSCISFLFFIFIRYMNTRRNSHYYYVYLLLCISLMNGRWMSSWISMSFYWNWTQILPRAHWLLLSRLFSDDSPHSTKTFFGWINYYVNDWTRSTGVCIYVAFLCIFLRNMYKFSSFFIKHLKTKVPEKKWCKIIIKYIFFHLKSVSIMYHSIV